MPSQNMPVQRQKGSTPTDGLSLLWAHNPFGGNFTFSGLYIMIYFHNKDQQDALFIIYSNESFLYMF